ncbi:2548_t:CDS:1, partial [Gigaspora rosea]
MVSSCSHKILTQDALRLDKPFYEESWNGFHHDKEDADKAINMVRNTGHGIVYLEDESFTIPEN